MKVRLLTGAAIIALAAAACGSDDPVTVAEPAAAIDPVTGELVDEMVGGETDTVAEPEIAADATAADTTGEAPAAEAAAAEAEAEAAEAEAAAAAAAEAEAAAAAAAEAEAAAAAAAEAEAAAAAEAEATTTTAAPTTSAAPTTTAAPVVETDVPAQDMIDVRTGATVNLRDFVDGSTPLLLWFWAPH